MTHYEPIFFPSLTRGHIKTVLYDIETKTFHKNDEAKTYLCHAVNETIPRDGYLSNGSHFLPSF
jgi:hypothetical protein